LPSTLMRGAEEAATAMRFRRDLDLV